MQKLGLRRQSLVLVAMLVVALLSASVFGLLDRSELSAVSWAFRLRGARPPGNPVIIVAIDDTTFDNTGLQWPWPRTYLAQLVDKLAAGGAKVIAFDVFLSDPEDLGKPATYTVQGDNLDAIAKRFGVEVTALRVSNGLDNSGRVCPGQSLTIPTNPPAPYTVVRDSLEEIAARYQVAVQTLAAANRVKDSCDLLPGQLLRVPTPGSVHYAAKAGDTVARIAGLFQVNPLAVVTANDQPASDPLTPGEALSVEFGDAAFAASIKAAGNVILNGEILRTTQAGSSLEALREPIPRLRDAEAGFGLTNIDADADGAVHRILAWDRCQCNDQVYYSWPIAAAALYRGQTPSAQTSSAFTLGSQRAPLERGFLRVNYLGPQATLPTYSALQVVNGDLPPETFKDKIVLIGATTQSLHDIYATPFVPNNPPGMPGVEIMGNALDTVLSGRFMFRLPLAMALVAILVAGGVALALTLIHRISLAIGVLAGLMAAYALAWLLAFFFLRTEMPFVGPELALFIGYVTPTLERAVSEELEKRRVRGLFELFISPEMVGQLIEQGVDAMRGKRAELTILFSDIRGFTTMSEKMTPEELVNLLNEYLGAMTEVIHRNGGTVDKYEGDLVMAFFGAPIAHPDHPQRAVRTSIEMRQELDRLRARWANEGKPSRLEMGIGLNTGEVFVGLVGSGKRVNYTVMGDAVNLASRLQDLTKELQWPLLISEFTYAKVKDEFDVEFGEARLVKGKTVPVGIYKVLGEKGAPEEKRVRALYA